MSIFWCKFGFGKCFGASSQSSYWAGHCQFFYEIHFMLHISLRNGLLLLCRIRENDTSKQRLLWFLVSSWGTHLLSFFTFSICFKCQMTIEWSTLSSSATSHVVIKGSASVIALGCCQLLKAIHYAPHLQGSRLCKTSCTTTIHLLAVPGPNALMLQVVSVALWPILNSNKKITQICFLSTVSIVSNLK